MLSFNPDEKLIKFACLALLGVACSASVLAQDATSFEEQRKFIRAPHANTVLGTNLFGDNVNLYNGSLTFSQTDVSLPGSNALPVMVGRRIATGENALNQIGRAFGRWELDIPHIHGTFPQLAGWKGIDNTDARCSKFGAPPTALGINGTSYWEHEEFWHGSFLYVPGGGDQRLLLRGRSNTVGPDGLESYPVVTTNFWAISCLPNLKNPGILTTQGEGFLAVSPDGTKYYFDWLVQYAAQRLTRATEYPLSTTISNSFARQLPTTESAIESTASTVSTNAHTSVSQLRGTISPAAIAKPALQRSEVWIMPTKVVDRFGNTVTYTYDRQKPKNLLRIDSSDGRSLVLTYMSDSIGGTDVVHTVSDGIRTWTYSYHGTSTTFNLDKVVLPDNSSWSFANFDDLLKPVRYLNNGSCEDKPYISIQDLTGSIAHPSGAVGTFTLRPTIHGRSHVPKACGDVTTPPVIPRFFVTQSLINKTIGGPGLGILTWNFDYGLTNESWDTCTNCASTKTVSVTDPNRTITRYSFGNWKDVSEGRLELTESGWNGTAVLKSVANSYRPFGAGPYPDPIGYGDPSNMGDESMESRLAPLFKRITTQQNVTFTWDATEFDIFAKPTQVSRYSSMGYSRAETTAYENNLTSWVLGKVKSVIDNGTGKVMLENEYDPATSVLLRVKKFGNFQQSMTYHADGTLHTVKDGKDKVTTYSNYMRGIAQRIDYPDGTSESAVVNNIGKITSLTNEANATTTFEYDAMGRLALIKHPAADSIAWSTTTVSFTPVGGTEFDLPAGHWKQVVKTGTGIEVSYFDALWRPVYTERWDDAERASTVRLVKRQYDFEGRQTFESYPKRAYQEIGSDGISSGYDALGRPTVRSMISELGTLSENNIYLNGYQKLHTDTSGNTTAYSYQAFDQPSEDAITNISMPEGVSVSIERDLFGKTKAITRSGNGLSLTRSYVYDSAERLCKTIEPETGATVQEYDGANNLKWRATGLPLSSLGSCDRESVAAPDKISFEYDPRNRLLTTTFGDNSATISRTYTPDGLTETISSNGTKWTYGYNKRRLLEHQSLAYGGRSFNIDQTYDANGSLSQLRYPGDNLTIAYNPNALGEPRQISNYATNITYLPSGAVAGFIYGNGIRRTMEQNIRGLPKRAVDTGVLDEAYIYTKNGNVESITDQLQGVATRGMTYDGLDRLSTTTAPNLWGTATYAYDALDNLISTSVTSGQNARTTIHSVDPYTNRLSSVSGGPAAFNFSYGYDARGNITRRGVQTYEFDLANRMKAAIGRGTYVYDGLGRRVSTVDVDGVNRVQVYSQNGQLLYTVPSNGSATKYIFLHNHQIAEVR